MEILKPIIDIQFIFKVVIMITNQSKTISYHLISRSFKKISRTDNFLVMNLAILPDFLSHPLHLHYKIILEKYKVSA